MLVLLTFLVLPRPVSAQAPILKFNHLSLEEGLSQSVVNSVLQDRQGFIWLATQDGLNRFDGYQFKVYKNDPGNPASLSNNFVWSIVEDPSGILWLGTNGGGLNRFDPQTQGFTHYLHDPGNSNSPSGNTILSIDQDRQGNLWLGTSGAGLNRFDPQTGQFTRYQNDPSDPGSLLGSSVLAIQEDSQGDLWVGTTDGGLNRLDPQTGKFTHYINVPDDPHSLSDNAVQTIYEDPQGVLWVGTLYGGLNRFDRQDNNFTRYLNDPADPHSLSNNSIYAIRQDQFGRLWVGTYGGGLNQLDQASGQFTHVRYDPGDPSSLSSDLIFTMYEDRAGVLWVGTFGGGASSHDPYRQKFGQYRADPSDPNSLGGNAVFSIYEDSNGLIWVGSFDGGLSRLDRSTGQWRHFHNDPTDPLSLSHNSVMSVLEDRQGAFWIATLGGGLNRFDPITEQFTTLPTHPVVNDLLEDHLGEFWFGSIVGVGNYDRVTGRIRYYQNDPDDPTSLSDNDITTLYEDAQGNLWVGTFDGGLNKFNRQDGSFTRYTHDPTQPGSLSNNSVISIFQASDGVLWVGTSGGLNKLEPGDGPDSFTSYHEKDGLPNEVIYGILEDQSGHLWLSTNKGLVKFDPQALTFESYTVQDGLQSNEFNQGAYFESPSGEMFFGGINGLNYFYPEQVKENLYQPPVVITDFQLFNKSVIPGQASPLQKPVEQTSRIPLSYKDDFLGFEFASLHYSSPQDIQYAYMMEGLEEDWNYVGNRRYASYTNMPPGDYIFRVKGTNGEGVWNEQGTSIEIVIPPPFWQTWWFRAIVVAGIAGVVMGVFALRIRAVEKQRQALEIQVNERTRELRQAMSDLERAKEAAEAASRAKSSFLANMSHEFRTPLNAILGFTQLMTRSSDLRPAEQENIEIIQRSSEHLLGLINDVLELSKIEAGRTILRQNDFDLHRMLVGLGEMFRLRAESKGIELVLEMSADLPRYVSADEGKLRQVLMNLLGNAVKFTQEGHVALKVKPSIHAQAQSDDPRLPGLVNLSFEVEDTGQGISPEEMAQLFEPFVQTSSGQRVQEGTGLGLPISRQYVRLMGGEISVESQPDLGSIFKFVLAVKLSDESSASRATPRHVIGLEPSQPTYRLLIVDDQEVNRMLLVKLFEPFGFATQEAANGQQAIEIWERWEPHLIWMDMRMPVLDGYAATRHIKSTVKGQATVIIALTASALEEDRAVILSEGCDDYVRKPFREAELFDILSRYLGVRFIYREAEPEGGPLAGAQVWTEQVYSEAQPGLVERLAAMPARWLSDLEQASLLGDLTAILGLLEQIRQSDPYLSDSLAELAQSFEHEKILHLIEQARRNSIPGASLMTDP